MTEHVDVLVVGAGISGIGAAYHLQDKCPGKTFAIMEARDRLGGTWDLFRYPGIRSDSEMYTLGYAFKPWEGGKAIAGGADILQYLRETAYEYDIERHIRYGHKVVAAAWSSEDCRWTVDVECVESGEGRQISCNFLFMASGYYRYAAGYTPTFPGRERFRGPIVHPQHWPDKLDYDGKRVVIIGSGATAVTLVPALAETAAHVTMLQRSPTYMASGPSVDALAMRLRGFLPGRLAYALVRWKNILVSITQYWYCRRYPERAAAFIIKSVGAALGPGHDIERDYTPAYQPWDQRICLVPDGDMFRVLRQGKASVVTGTIDSFTGSGILLESGEELEADLIVTATGLDMVLFEGMVITVDGEIVKPSEHLTYKGMMLNDIPNMAFSMGYTNASWTLKVDLTCNYMCRTLNYMYRHGYRQCVPRRRSPSPREEPIINFTSGYIQRALADWPQQGDRSPWKMHQNYILDFLSLGFGRIADKTMEFD